MNSRTISEFLEKVWEFAWHKKCFAATIVLFFPTSVIDFLNFAIHDLCRFLVGVFLNKFVTYGIAKTRLGNDASERRRRLKNHWVLQGEVDGRFEG